MLQQLPPSPTSGEMERRILELDWSQTALGPRSDWPQSLRTAVSIMLASRFPILIWWGPELIKLYNDAYRPILGVSKHPMALGQPGRLIWSEIWDVIGPMLDSVLREGRATWSDGQLLIMDRYGYLEETYFTFSYSPITDESGGIGGVFTVVTEMTQQVLSERRLRALSELATKTLGARTTSESCRLVAETLAAFPKDIPFALLYLVSADNEQAVLMNTTGIEPEQPVSPQFVSLREKDARWPFGEMINSGETERRCELYAEMDHPLLTVWGVAPNEVLILPLAHSIQEQPAGFMVMGLNPRRALDEAYRSFLKLVATQISASLGSARAYEQERQRNEALAALDQAKTTFFNNVSHEFRTPLTLVLDPLRRVLQDEANQMNAEQRAELELAQRNGRRLLKLVNTLLDFSRIEASRAEVVYEPTDLADYTANLASAFRSGIENAGLRFVVDCPPLPELIYIDREMWEKIILNLLSNAYKFTFEGEISVRLRWLGATVELEVADTGIGVAPENIPHLFERFYRVRNARARSYEGTGIGLALVRELVRLHNGDIQVESGQGTRFLIRLPTGSAHLTADQIATRRELSSTAIGAAPYLEDVSRWSSTDTLPEPFSPESRTTISAPATHGMHILLVDDNADMRAYLMRLLTEQGCVVESASDGASALVLAQTNMPDLVLSDVMMPGLDGFGLLAGLRADPNIQTIPILLLSARAGEEARLEGLQAGADAYLVKPFSARELIATVNAQLGSARLRQQLTELQAQLLESAEASIKMRDEFISVAAHELKTPLTSLRGFVQLLMRQLSKRGTIEPGQLQRALTTLDSQSTKLIELLNQLLDLSRLEAGRLALSRRKTDLCRLLSDVIETVQRTTVTHTISLSGPQSCHAWVDPIRLEQVLVNLLNNAIKYSPEGGPVEVTLDCPDPSRAQISVRDHGLGVPVGRREHLFERFYQAHGTGYLGGMGLGLYISRQIVELHDGVIRAEFPEGNGTRFVVSLPLEQPVMEVN